jgi:hypothetical protein
MASVRSFSRHLEHSLGCVRGKSQKSKSATVRGKGLSSGHLLWVYEDSRKQVVWNLVAAFTTESQDSEQLLICAAMSGM